MKIVVCGGRNFTDRDVVYAALDAYHAFDPITLLIEGGQRSRDETTGRYIGGADYWAQRWATERRVPWITEGADWRRHGNAAGPIRNNRMVAMKPDIVVAFPGGRGTRDMCAKARAAGIEVREVSVREPAD